MLPSKRTLQTIESPIKVLLDAVDMSKIQFNMAQGMSFYTPPLEQLKVDDMEFKYGQVEGQLILRKKLEEKLEKFNGINPKERKVMVTAGANQGLYSILTCVSDPGDRVLFFKPFYFNAVMAAQLLGLEIVGVDCNEKFEPQLESIDWNVKAILMISPSNPSGFVFPREMVEKINEECRKRKIWLISDETYEQFLFDGAKHTTPYGDHVINLYSFSKAFGIAGLRVGYISYPISLHESLAKVQDTIPISASQFSQKVAFRCLNELGLEWVEKQVKVMMQQNRDMVWSVLERYQQNVVKTNGAFYFLLKLPLGIVDLECCKKFAENFGLLVIPITKPAGLLKEGNSQFLRISYGNLAPEKCKLACESLSKALEQLFSNQ